MNNVDRGPSIRQKKTSEMIRRISSRAIIFDLLKDTDFQNCVSISRVTISPDLKSATVFVVVDLVDDEKKKFLLDFLKNKIPFIKNKIGAEIQMKSTPSIEIKPEKNHNNLDIDTITNIQNIDSLL